MSKRKLYSFSAVLLLAGYCYLAYGMLWGNNVFDSTSTPCLFKNLTGIPCPSCGATRSVACLLQGHLVDGLYWNPIGLLLLGGMIILPMLLLYDLLTAKSVYYKLYLRAEQFLLQKTVKYAAIALVVVNWIWNINKGL